MFAQSGLYLMEEQQSMMFPVKDDKYEMQFFVAIFKDNELHCGFPSVASPQCTWDFNESLIEQAGFVCYLSKKAIERASSKMAVFPSGCFFGMTSDSVGARLAPTLKCSVIDFLLNSVSCAHCYGIICLIT